MVRMLTIEAALEAGFDEHNIKPPDPEHLGPTVARADRFDSNPK